MRMAADTFERLALKHNGRLWELDCGRLREKPGMTARHADIGRQLLRQLVLQLDHRQYSVTERTHLRVPESDRYYIPDVCIIPRHLWLRQDAERPTNLEVYTDPLPFVAEVWSPSTGGEEFRRKLASYQERGDEEIWHLHPRERVLTRWQRLPDGSYSESTLTDGRVPLTALPAVTIDIADLFML